MRICVIDKGIKKKGVLRGYNIYEFTNDHFDMCGGGVGIGGY